MGGTQCVAQRVEHTMFRLRSPPLSSQPKPAEGLRQVPQANVAIAARRALCAARATCLFPPATAGGGPAPYGTHVHHRWRVANRGEESAPRAARALRLPSPGPA
jgi:hypothetical protein